MKPRIAIPVPTSFDLEYNRLNSSAYAEATRESGGDAVWVGLDLGARELGELMTSCDGILLPGSPADVSPERYGQARAEATAEADAARERTDIALLEHGLQHRKPILGICFGAQMMNVHCGGTLIQDLAVMPVNHAAGRAVAVAHTIVVAEKTRLAAVVDREKGLLESKNLCVDVNSSHHQAVGIVGRGLRVSARSSVDAVVEGIEVTDSDAFVLGVQWHPERSFGSSPASDALFAHFVAAAAVFRGSRSAAETRV